MKTLVVLSSPRGDRSKSNELALYAASKFGGEQIILDLYNEYVPYLSNAVIAMNYGFGDYASLSSEDKKVADAQTRFVEILLSVDNVVIAAPMWNFSMPGILKAWFDLVLQVNKTFSMDAAGYHGLVKNIKKAIIVGARGAEYAGTAFAGYDFLAPHISGLLGFVGITEQKSFWLEGINTSADKIDANNARLQSEIDAYVGA